MVYFSLHIDHFCIVILFYFLICLFSKLYDMFFVFIIIIIIINNAICL
jgi:hypothetical protein